MSSLDDLLNNSGLTSEQIGVIRSLISDWQLIADLTFSDLVLWVPQRGDSKSWPMGHQAVAQMRPTTGSTVIPYDVVGSTVAWSVRPELDAVLTKDEIVRSRVPITREGNTFDKEAIPVRFDGQTIAVLARYSNALATRTPSRLELTYLQSGQDLIHMLSEGLYPEKSTVGDIRVGDGLIRTDATGRISFASPNAVSALRRFGIETEIENVELGRLIFDALSKGAPTPVDESIIAIFNGKFQRELDLERRSTSISARVIPLRQKDQRIGALVLLRDITELRHRERELLSKDVTIREIHHRVKNNLQTVSALLRLQARRLSDPAGKAALVEAERRVAAIAVVHETLSNDPNSEELVDLNLIIDRLLRLVVDVANTAGRIKFVRRGEAGTLLPHQATPLAMVLAELFQNALEHGLLQSGDELLVQIERDREQLQILVADNGVGLPDNFSIEASTNLGLQIVKTLTENELRGTISLSPRASGGTDALLSIPLG